MRIKISYWFEKPKRNKYTLNNILAYTLFYCNLSKIVLEYQNATEPICHLLIFANLIYIDCLYDILYR